MTQGTMMTQFVPGNYTQVYQRPVQQMQNGFAMPQNTASMPESPSKLNTPEKYYTWVNPRTGAANGQDTKLSILHVNDNHRKVSGLTRIKTGFEKVTQALQGKGIDLLKIHSGDYMLDVAEKKHQVQVGILNSMGIQYAAIGNHEFDKGTQNLIDQLKQAHYKSLSANLTTPPESGMQELEQLGKFAKSTIHEVNGNKYGLVGISPIDLYKTTSKAVVWKGVDVMNADDTIKAVQTEVNKLKQQGINKIILVSHGGIDIDKEVAKRVDGVDIILGGHTHDLLEPFKPGVSLFESPSGEPVMLFIDGKDGKFFGVTDAVFDQNGILKSAIARHEHASNFEMSPEALKIEDNILGSSPIIGTFADNYKLNTVKTGPNAIANFVADACREKTGADICLIRSSAIRDDIPKGPVTTRFVEELAPFMETLYVERITGQDIVTALQNGADSFIRANKRPGILQPSGVRYTIDENCKVANVSVLNKQGQYEPIDLNKEYDVAVDQFALRAGDGYETLAQPMSVIRATLDNIADIITWKMKSMNNQPIQMVDDSRVVVKYKGQQKAAPATTTPPQPAPKQPTPLPQPTVAMQVPVRPTQPQYYYTPPAMQYYLPVVPQPYYYMQQPPVYPQQAAVAPTSYVR